MNPRLQAVAPLTVYGFDAGRAGSPADGSEIRVHGRRTHRYLFPRRGTPHPTWPLSPQSHRFQERTSMSKKFLIAGAVLAALIPAGAFAQSSGGAAAGAATGAAGGAIVGGPVGAGLRGGGGGG